MFFRYMKGNQFGLGFFDDVMRGIQNLNWCQNPVRHSSASGGLANISSCHRTLSYLIAKQTYYAAV